MYTVTYVNDLAGPSGLYDVTPTYGEALGAVLSAFPDAVVVMGAWVRSGNRFVATIKRA